MPAPPGTRKTIRKNASGPTPVYVNAARPPPPPPSHLPKVGIYTVYEMLKAAEPGGTGTEVLLAEHPHLRCKVVLKRPGPQLPEATRRAASDRLEREARWLATRDHSGFVRVLDLFGEPPDRVMVLLYYQGAESKCSSLEQLFDATKRVSEKEMRRGLPSLIRALEASHRVGVFHLDITPDNVLITQDSAFVLTDFGIAVGPDFPPKEDYFEGKPGYAPPEQYACRFVPATDYFSLAVTIVECVNGVAPWEPEEMDALIQRGALLPPPRLEGLSPALRSAVEPYLKVKADQRPRSLDALRRWADTHVGGEEEPSNSPGLLFVGGVLICVLSAVIMVGLVFWVIWGAR